MKNPDLEKIVNSGDSKLKELIIDFVGEEIEPENLEVTVEDILEVFSNQFPEFVLALAEENFIRGYSQALIDIEGTNNKKSDA